jgi:hypothetical protein
LTSQTRGVFRKLKCNWVQAVQRSQTTLSDHQVSELLFDCISS